MVMYMILKLHLPLLTTGHTNRKGSVQFLHLSRCYHTFFANFSAGQSTSDSFVQSMSLFRTLVSVCEFYTR